MNKKKLIGSLLIIILILSLGLYFYKFYSNKKEKSSNVSEEEVFQGQEHKNSQTHLIGNGENKYYHVYIKYNNTGVSFVPLKLNPDFEENSDYNVSTSIDDDGNIINDGKIIVIDNFVISDENKEMIKNIAGRNYDDALKEIEDEVNKVKSEFEK